MKRMPSEQARVKTRRHAVSIGSFALTSEAEATVTKWDTQREERRNRLKAAAPYAKDKVVQVADVTALLEAIIKPGDRVVLKATIKSRRICSPRPW